MNEMCNLQMEREVIGHCLLDRDLLTVTLPTIEAGDFYDYRHVLIWRALTDGAVPEANGVFAALGPDAIKVGQIYLYEIGANLGASWAVSHHVAALIQLAAVRRAMSEIFTLYQSAKVTPPAEWLESVDAFSIKAKTHKKNDGESIGAVVGRVWSDYHATTPLSDVTPTNIDWLDKILGGGLASAMHVIAARPGQGKTALATQIGVSVARQFIGEVLFFCCEMPNFTQVQRMLAQRGPDLNGIKTRGLGMEGYADFRDAAGELGSLPLTMFDAASVTVERIRAISVRAANRGKVAAVIIDYYQLIRTTARLERRLDALVHISIEFAVLARTLNCPVIVLAQLSRAVETDKRKPLMSDLADCSQLEKDAHTVIFPYLPAKMNQGTDPGEAIVIMAKNRGGPTGQTAPGQVRWNGKHVRFDGS